MALILPCKTTSFEIPTPPIPIPPIPAIPGIPELLDVLEVALIPVEFTLPNCPAVLSIIAGAAGLCGAGVKLPGLGIPILPALPGLKLPAFGLPSLPLPPACPL